MRSKDAKRAIKKSNFKNSQVENDSAWFHKFSAF